MTKHFTHRTLLSAVALAIGLAIGVVMVSNAKATNYSDPTSNSIPVIELGIPVSKTLPVRLIAGGSLRSP